MFKILCILLFLDNNYIFYFKEDKTIHEGYVRIMVLDLVPHRLE